MRPPAGQKVCPQCPNRPSGTFGRTQFRPHVLALSAPRPKGRIQYQFREVAGVDPDHTFRKWGQKTQKTCPSAPGGPEALLEKRFRPNPNPFRCPIGPLRGVGSPYSRNGPENVPSKSFGAPRVTHRATSGRLKLVQYLDLCWTTLGGKTKPRAAPSGAQQAAQGQTSGLGVWAGGPYQGLGTTKVGVSL